MTVGIIDYGMGNLASVQRAFAELGAPAVILSSPVEIATVSRLVLPGVGSFRQAMENLSSGGWLDAVKEAVQEDGRPLLGICLGMQLLAERGTEHGDSEGLGLVPGQIEKLEPEKGSALRVPHVGWNEIDVARPDPLVAGIESGTDFYFVHSFYFNAASAESVIARTPYGRNFPSIVSQNKVWGAQFHPEKSGPAGLKLLTNFKDL